LPTEITPIDKTIKNKIKNLIFILDTLVLQLVEIEIHLT